MLSSSWFLVKSAILLSSAPLPVTGDVCKTDQDVQPASMDQLVSLMQVNRQTLTVSPYSAADRIGAQRAQDTHGPVQLAPSAIQQMVKDSIVISNTGDHAAAKAAARQSPYVKALLVEAGEANRLEPEMVSQTLPAVASGLSPWQQKIARAEKKIYSQSYQDGVLDFLFKELGTTNKFYVEFGFNSATFEGGSGPNSLNLHKQGWTGLLLDGGNANPAINLQKEIIGPHDIVSLLKKYSVPEEADYVSIDFDSYDLWVLREIIVKSSYRPRVVTIEYNAAYPLDSTLCLNYPESDGFWPQSDGVFGTSLGAIDLVAREGGYSLVYAVSGLDAFLVRSDLLKERGIETASLLSVRGQERLVDNSTKRVCDGSLEGWLTLGGNGAAHLGYWCMRNKNKGVRVDSIEDYAVFQSTGDHAAAKAAARQSPYVKALLVEAGEANR